MPVYIHILITVMLVYFSIVNLISYKFNVKDFILMIITTEVLSLGVVGFGEFFVIIPIIIIATIFLYKNSKNIILSISIPIVAILIGVVSDYIISNMYIFIFNINITRNNLTITNFILEVMLCLAISKFIGIIINKNIKGNNLRFKGKFGILIVLSLILTLIIFYTNIILGSKAGFNNDVLRINGILFLAYFLLLGIIIYILLRSLTKELEFRSKQNEFENLKQYTDSLERLYSDMRVFRHDYINIISSMIGYIENKDMDGLENHFYENIIPVSKSMQKNNFKIGVLKNIRLPELKGIVSSKLIRAQEMGIDVHIEIFDQIESINMNIIDISRVIGILLDNAIEAAEKGDKPSLNLAFIKRERSVLILISNSYSEETISINKIFEPGYSTKGEGRGLGLSNLKQIIRKYSNVFLDTKIEENFMQELEITNE